MGGDVPDTNYLFMGMTPLPTHFPACPSTDCLRPELEADQSPFQAISSTVDSTPSSHSSSFSASRSATLIA